MTAKNFWFLTAAAAAATLAAPAAAQVPSARTVIVPGAATEIPQLDAIDFTRLRPIAQRYDAQIETAFKGNEKLKAAMQAELRAISLEKDAGRRAAMVKAYQTKYASQYSAVLKKANVDLSAMAREMNAAVPDLDFTVKNGFSIAGKLKAKPGATLPATGGRSTASNTGSLPALSTETTETPRDSDFEQRVTHNCGVISGQSGSAANNAIRLFSFAVEAGQCPSRATRSYAFDVASDEEVELSIRLNTVTETYALGILGLASARANADVHLSKVSSSGRFIESLASENFGDSYAFAPFLAADDDSDEFTNARFERTIRNPGRYQILFAARVDPFAGGLVAGTTAASDMTRISVTITRRKK